MNLSLPSALGIFPDLNQWRLFYSGIFVDRNVRVMLYFEDFYFMLCLDIAGDV